MTHTENAGSKSGKGDIINIKTTSTTAAFTEGKIIELDSLGYARQCATIVSTRCIGVCVNGLPELTAARVRNLAVQVSGVVAMNGWYDQTFTTTCGAAVVPGDCVVVGGDKGSTRDGQIVGRCQTSNASIIGIALEPITATDTTTVIKVLLNRGHK